MCLEGWQRRELYEQCECQEMGIAGTILEVGYHTIEPEV